MFKKIKNNLLMITICPEILFHLYIKKEMTDECLLPYFKWAVKNMSENQGLNMKKTKNNEITDTVLLFGRSPFLNEINIKKILKLPYTTIGINLQDFKTDYTTFLDKEMAFLHESLPGTLITWSQHQVRKPVIYYDYYECNFTHDYILKWLEDKCTNVILIGCADFCNDGHYNSLAKFRPDINATKKSIKFIESISSLRIYKMNPNGVLNIPIWEKGRNYISYNSR